MGAPRPHGTGAIARADCMGYPRVQCQGEEKQVKGLRWWLWPTTLHGALGCWEGGSRQPGTWACACMCEGATMAANTLPLDQGDAGKTTHTRMLAPPCDARCAPAGHLESTKVMGRPGCVCARACARAHGLALVHVLTPNGGVNC